MRTAMAALCVAAGTIAATPAQGQMYWRVEIGYSKANDTDFTIALIPHTTDVTTLGSKRAGDKVNLEVDLVAKYVERLLLKKEA